MAQYNWMLSGVILFLVMPFSLQQQSPLCVSTKEQFMMQYPGGVSDSCMQLQTRFNATTYRINFTESEVNSVCSSDACHALMVNVTLSCNTFAKKDLNCLDSPGLIRVWCSRSDRNNNTNCFTSLTNQGVISMPYLLTSCLNSIYNAESCSSYCKNLLSNRDCCFASYYAFMIDAFVSSGGFPVFENYMRFLDGFWSWCNLTSPGICPGLNLTDYSPRDNNATCEFQPTNTTNTATSSLMPMPTTSTMSSQIPTSSLRPMPTTSNPMSMSSQIPTSSPMPSDSPESRGGAACHPAAYNWLSPYLYTLVLLLSYVIKMF